MLDAGNGVTAALFSPQAFIAVDPSRILDGDAAG